MKTVYIERREGVDAHPSDPRLYFASYVETSESGDSGGNEECWFTSLSAAHKWIEEVRFNMALHEHRTGGFYTDITVFTKSEIEARLRAAGLRPNLSVPALVQLLNSAGADFLEEGPWGRLLKA